MLYTRKDTPDLQILLQYWGQDVSSIDSKEPCEYELNTGSSYFRLKLEDPKEAQQNAPLEEKSGVAQSPSCPKGKLSASGVCTLPPPSPPCPKLNLKTATEMGVSEDCRLVAKERLSRFYLENPTGAGANLCFTVNPDYKKIQDFLADKADFESQNCDAGYCCYSYKNKDIAFYISISN